MSFTDVVIFNFVFLLCFIIQCIVVIIRWNGRTSSSRNNFAIKPHKIKQLQISAQMKLCNKSELIEHVFRKTRNQFSMYIYMYFERNIFEKFYTKTTNLLRIFCRSKFFLLKLNVYQSISSACTIFPSHFWTCI